MQYGLTANKMLATYVCRGKKGISIGKEFLLYFVYSHQKTIVSNVNSNVSLGNDLLPSDHAVMSK